MFNTSPEFNLGHGGGIIKRKSIMTVLLVFIMALSLSTSTAFAKENNNNTSSSQLNAGEKTAFESQSTNQLKTIQQTTQTTQIAGLIQSTLTNKTTQTSTNIAAGSPQVSFTSKQINDASKKVKTFVETNSRLPNYVTIGTYQITTPQFLQLIAQNILNINSGSATAIPLITVNSPSSATETLTNGNIYKSEYITLAKNVITHINTNNQAPSYVSSSLGNIKFDNLVYTFSKILNYQATNNRLPNYVSVSAASTSEGTGSSTSVKTTLDAIGKAEAKYGDVQGISDVATFVRLGYGDCWADSMWLYSKLTSTGILARIMGYVNGGYGVGYRHAWVQINTGNGWVNWDYSGYNSQHYGDVGTGTPKVLIGPGVSNPSILSTGY
ncbi:MAG: Pseudomurein-binding repeat protein [Methanobacterium sp. PtaU1.Bin242]|nr:MAG: Pseudomurein-binding repeat protein [Methanobacterium sp. PtaU1.Bin242]